MGNLTAAILTLVLISPSIIVLVVIIYREIREFWRWIAPFCSRGLSQVDCATSLLRVQRGCFVPGALELFRAHRKSPELIHQMAPSARTIFMGDLAKPRWFIY